MPSPRAPLHSDSPSVRLNRLAREKSPYLLQHARNPVDWFPWGNEAFDKARREDKPIFLSIGYSTCHWCHVMERESFESDVVAKILNDHFVSVKLDREERPDIDRVYMTFVQATTGGGGWPLSVFLTPQLKPFFGGTYFPPEDKWGRPGFKTVLLRIHELWQRQRDKLTASADAITERLRELSSGGQARASAGVRVLDLAFNQFASQYDPQFGGFGGAPKFPRPATLRFLLRYHARTNNEHALAMTLHTLRKMADGGLHDHLGGGFHRYSVDARWHVPHFEKMLYDQAQLAIAYLEAFQICRNDVFADTARGILDYVARDLTGAEGNFFSAEDADSSRSDNPAEKSEGAFYVWEKSEIANAARRADLPAAAAEIFCHYYGVGESGNVSDDPQGEFIHKNILIVSSTVEDTAKHFGRSPNEVRAALATLRSALLTLRTQRPRPHLDDKTITAWNGLMISAFARASGALPTNDRKRYRRAAERAALFIQNRLYDKATGGLLRRFRDGDAAIEAFADDYAFFIQGLLDLYEASFDPHWLAFAAALQEKQITLFWDNRNGGFFTTTGCDAAVLLRIKEDYDGAEPSPASVSALNLLRLAAMTGRDQFRSLAHKTLQSVAHQLNDAPTAMPEMLCALDFSLSPIKQIVIAGEPDTEETRALQQAVAERFIPNKILLLADVGAAKNCLAPLHPSVAAMKPLHGKPTAYVCENFTCRLPVTSPQELAAQLSSAAPA
jgi:uncharacterized protein YyaL (SSP411 family)